MQKNKTWLCPLPYEEVLEDIIKIVWTEQYGYLEELRYLGKASCTSLPRVKPGWSFVCLPYASSWGATSVKMQVS